jgi:hypothetical protein
VKRSGNMGYSSEYEQPTDDRGYCDGCYKGKGDRENPQKDQDYRHGNSPTACSFQKPNR